ncbi:winged helix DNA-binding domain-containing protein [Actinomadura madurae]|nr:crosslink repair DNA glycosylase YcaQ family protein [Actinomadura madurae]MCQ0017425.1 winged helix DNA-binding domain-containing protein [Actinomadura madurae]
MRDVDVARWRLRGQHLVRPHAGSAGEVVGSLLAVQAENPGQAAWAVAARTRNPDQADLATLLDDGSVVRTHVLRPTWHYVQAEDVGWLLDLTGPRVRRLTGQQLRNAHGLDERSIDQAVVAVLEALASRGHLTRAQLAEELSERGVPGGGQMLMILLAHAELDGLICSGRVADGEHTYALMAERVRHRGGSPGPRPWPNSRCATTPGTARRPNGTWPTGRRSPSPTCAPVCTRCVIGWTRSSTTGALSGTPPENLPANRRIPQAISCRSSTRPTAATRTPAGCWTPPGDVPRTREAATGMALVDAQLVASMRRTIGRDRVRFDLRPYRALTRPQIEALDQAARRYGEYLQLKAEITLP